MRTRESYMLYNHYLRVYLRRRLYLSTQSESNSVALSSKYWTNNWRVVYSKIRPCIIAELPFVIISTYSAGPSLNDLRALVAASFKISYLRRYRFKLTIGRSIT
jgi:hypothetical protein